METIMAMMPNTIEGWLGLITAVVTLASIIAKFTPSKSDNQIMDALLDILHVLAVNARQDKARPVKPDTKPKTMVFPMGGDK